MLSSLLIGILLSRTWIPLLIVLGLGLLLSTASVVILSLITFVLVFITPSYPNSFNNLSLSTPIFFRYNSYISILCLLSSNKLLYKPVLFKSWLSFLFSMTFIDL